MARCRGPLDRDRADGTYTLREAIVQADNNDAYLLSYRDLKTGDWQPLWTVPPAYSFGMATRPDPLDDASRQTLPKIVTTNAVRLEAEFGDGMSSVSEIQLFGEPRTFRRTARRRRREASRLMARIRAGAAMDVDSRLVVGYLMALRTSGMRSA